MIEMDWIAQAACAGMDTELFFHSERNSLLMAQAICQECPVRAQCLAEALKAEGDSGYGYRYGIFGGMGPRARAAVA